MVNKPLIRPYFLGAVALGGAARIPLNDALPVHNNGSCFTTNWSRNPRYQILSSV